MKLYITRYIRIQITQYHNQPHYSLCRYFPEYPQSSVCMYNMYDIGVCVCVYILEVWNVWLPDNVMSLACVIRIKGFINWYTFIYIYTHSHFYTDILYIYICVCMYASAQRYRVESAGSCWDLVQIPVRPF